VGGLKAEGGEGLLGVVQNVPPAFAAAHFFIGVEHADNGVLLRVNLGQGGFQGVVHDGDAALHVHNARAGGFGFINQGKGLGDILGEHGVIMPHQHQLAGALAPLAHHGGGELLPRVQGNGHAQGFEVGFELLGKLFTLGFVEAAGGHIDVGL
jgi:hypothetical protein